jgi:hypothetical protein
MGPGRRHRPGRHVTSPADRIPRSPAGDWTRAEQDTVLARLGYKPRSPAETAEIMRTVGAQAELRRVRAQPPPVKAYLLTVTSMVTGLCGLPPENEPAGLFTTEMGAKAAAEGREKPGLVSWVDVNEAAGVAGNRLWYSAGVCGYTVREMDVQP